MKTETIKCHTCDGTLANNAKFCPHCGGRHYNGVQRMTFRHLFIAASLFAFAMVIISQI